MDIDMNEEVYVIDVFEDDDVDLSDILSSEEIDEMKRKQRQKEENCGITMNSLGLSDRDFF